ncbi:PH domain-containing protein [Lysinibacillus sphaericus]|uniref:PH domain-containing protein n=1 Tax=Lysinibacillus sphaericus TaxID=1421 RepID=UPI0013B08B9A|nr:PH domain-containing protein [Lysinibacillus sphaericus]MBG9691893.1 membrane protein [Lysinibacillus sphaericus]QIC47516.1 PH domain-containing protein [Lysinibacillus sphaericus]
MRAQPVHQISRKGLTVWRLYGVIQTVVLLIAAGIVGYGTYYFDWPTFIYYIAGAIVILSAILSIFIFPKIRWERWRYEVREHEIEVQHGLFVVKRTLIPMVRVQHVDTTQGPILKKYDLGNISISTAATVHTIPALIMDEADSLRARISELARVAEDDV